MEKTIIEKAEKEDHKELTNLIKKSKAHWGYTPSQISEWDSELTMTENYIHSNEVFKLGLNNYIIGCYSYLKLENHTIKLDFFFIAPSYISNGYGKLLILHFFERIKKKL